MLDYNYFKSYYNMVATDLSKQQALDSDPKAVEQINFTTNLDQAGQAAMYFIIEEAKENVSDFSTGFFTFSESIAVLFGFNIISI